MASEPQQPVQDTSSIASHMGYESTSTALKSLITDAANNHQASPHSHLHAPAHHDSSHAWIKKHFESAAATAKFESYENRFHLGNFVIDRQTGKKNFEEMSMYVRLGMHLLYYGSAQEKALHWHRTVDLLKDQSEKMGKEYDSPESKDHIRPFIESFQLQDTLVEMVEPDPDKYPTFNAFFAREIKPDARPVAEPENELVATCAADCRLSAFPTIDLATKYWIKGKGFTISRLLGDNDQLAQQFDGGSITVHRLAPQDYHRWHAPVSGTVESIHDIPGAYYTVNPQAINESGAMDVFCENRRSVMIVRRTPTNSQIAIIAVGAMLVGTIKYVPEVEKVGSVMKRGQCLGMFQYGGSTVIVLYPKGEVKLDEDLVKNSVEQNCETLMKVGWRIGVKQ